MSTLYERDVSCRFAVAPELMGARVRIGWRTYQAQVTEVSRGGFTIALPEKAARKVPQGTEFELSYRGERWLVGCESRNQSGDGIHTVSVVSRKDLTRMSHRDASIRDSLFGGIKLNATDPGLSVGVIAGIVLVLLVSPGWGDELGTSDYLTDLLKKIVDGLKEAVGS